MRTTTGLHRQALSRTAWLGAAMLALACGDSAGTTGGAGGGATTATTTTTAGTGGAATGTGGATSVTIGAGGMMVNPGTLVDDGLVARYLMNEADVGQTPTALADSAPTPLAIPITYTPELVWAADVNGHRGLRFQNTNNAGRASVAVDGTKISQALHGSTTATIEVVADVLDVDNPAPYFFIGQYYWGGALSFMSWRETLLTVYMNDGDGWIDCFVDVPAEGRTVYHAVIDTNATDEAERMRIYVNGARIVPIDSGPPVAALPIDLSVGNLLVLGNDGMSDLSPEGTLYYVAVYSAPFTDDQVLQNTGILLYSDDAPSL